MTVDEVMETWDDACSESIDDFNDPDEPTMEGSDDEFSDLEDVDGYDSKDELDDVSPFEDPTAPPDDNTLDSSMDSDSDTQLLISASLNGPQH